MAEDYPRTLMELERRFGDEPACRTYLAALRWPDGFVCPACQGRESLEVRRERWRCVACRREVTVMSGTVFQDSKLPLMVWFRAMWQVTAQKNGVSAMGLQRVLGLGSYKTAWTVLHKLRRAMVRPGRDRLHGLVEIDEVLKRWLLGTHQGAVGADYLQDYLDEFTFRFNRRTSASRGKLFYRLAQQAAQVAPTTYDALGKHKL